MGCLQFHEFVSHGDSYETVSCSRNLGHRAHRRPGLFVRLRRFIKLHATASGRFHYQLHYELSHNHGWTKHDLDWGIRQRNRRDYSGQHCRCKRHCRDCDSHSDDYLYAHCDPIEWGSGDCDCQRHGEPGAPDDYQLCGQPDDHYCRAERNFDWSVCQRDGSDHAGQYFRHQWNGGDCEPNRDDYLHFDCDAFERQRDHGDSDCHCESGYHLNLSEPWEPGHSGYESTFGNESGRMVRLAGQREFNYFCI